MSSPRIVKIAVEGRDGKTRFKEAGAIWEGKEGGKVAMRIELFAHSLTGEYIVFNDDAQQQDED